MTGKSHLAMNITTAAVAADLYFLATSSQAPDVLANAAESCASFLFEPGKMPMFVFAPCAAVLYLIGALLPDIDVKHSMLGRIIHIPVEHRTWTHAFYIISLPFLLLGIGTRLLFWLGIGSFLHLFYDHFSAWGTRWFYPLPNGYHWARLYHTGKASEYIFDTVAVLLAIGLTVFSVWFRFFR